MERPTHTPAPWCRSWINGALRHIERNVDYDAFWTPTDEENAALDANELYLPSYYIATHDVCLIAAAPDLLAACEDLLENLRRDSGHLGSPHVDHAIALGEAAIAKAKGGA